MESFWLRVALSFVVGGVWLMLVSVVAEKSGHKLAALLGGLPSTLLIALFFIGLNKGPAYAARATIVAPTAFIIDAYFVLLLGRLAKLGYLLGLTLSGIFWFIAMGVVVMLNLNSYVYSLSVWLLGLTVLLLIIKRVLPTVRVSSSKVTYSSTQLMLRSLFAGAVIAAAVIVSKYSGPIVGGIFTAFPAVYISTFTILYFARGVNFSQAFVKPLIISGSINTTVYGVAAYFLYPKYGIYTGTLAAFLISLFCSFYIVRNLLNVLLTRKLI